MCFKWDFQQLRLQWFDALYYSSSAMVPKILFRFWDCTKFFLGGGIAQKLVLAWYHSSNSTVGTQGLVSEGHTGLQETPIGPQPSPWASILLLITLICNRSLVFLAFLWWVPSHRFGNHCNYVSQFGIIWPDANGLSKWMEQLKRMNEIWEEKDISHDFLSTTANICQKRLRPLLRSTNYSAVGSLSSADFI